MDKLQPVIDQFKKVAAKIDEKLQDNEQAQKLAKQTGQKPSTLVFAAIGVFFFLSIMFASFNTLLLLTNVPAMFPLYASLKAIKSPKVEDDKQWLVYWVVFGSWIVCESIFFTFFGADPCQGSGSALSLVTFAYLVGKVVFFVWAGQSQGAVIVYDTVISKVFDKVEAIVDGVLAKKNE